ncbi:ribonuclease H-like domain-containing protein, partial [Tanacetum coccineum]
MYSFDLKNVVPSRGLTCLFAKATIDESNLWHRRLGHINFKTMNKLVRGNLVRGLPLKLFENDHTCVACQKGKQHKASYHKVKTIRCDNGTEFKNRIMNEFCEMKGIRREFSIARTPQQNGVAERKNRTLTEATRTMLANSKLPTTFWAEAVNTACYVQNRVLVIKPHNKNPYERFLGRKPALSFIRPFGCHVTILNTLDHPGKFDGKSDDGFFVGYSINSKAFRVFNTRTRFVEENLHINFLENKPNVARTVPNWMFDIDTLTMSMNYQPVFAGNQTNDNAITKANIVAGQAGKKTVSGLQYVLLPFLTSDSQGPKSSKDEVADDAGKKNEAQDPSKEGQEKDVRDQEEALRKQFGQEIKRLPDPGRERAQRNEFKSMFGQDKDTNGNSTYRMFNPVNASGSSYENLGGSIPVFPNDDFPTDLLMPDLEDTTDLQVTSIFSGAYDDEDVGAEADLNNLETTMSV